MDWQHWRRQIFGDPYMVWHDGPYFDDLLARARVDPAEVAVMLAAGVREQDPVAAQSYAALHEAGLAPADAVSLLTAAIAAAAPDFVVAAAPALLVLTGDQSWSVPLVTVLAGRSSEYTRLRAAMVLADFRPTPALIAALGKAVTDRAYLVRHHAASTLLGYAGLPGDIAADKSLHATVVMSKSRKDWSRGAELLTTRALAALNG